MAPLDLHRILLVASPFNPLVLLLGFVTQARRALGATPAFQLAAEPNANMTRRLHFCHLLFVSP